MRLLVPLSFVLLILAAVATADPYGPPHAVTDMAPFCAGCHAAVGPEQMPDLPREAAENELSENKHLNRMKGNAAYKDLTDNEIETLRAAIAWMDSKASISIKAPPRAKRNSRIEVTVVTRGGAGPVIAVSLVDSVVRYQARPITATGFKIIGPPLIVGPNGKTQSEWINRRLRGTDLGLNTVLISGIQGDTETGRVDETTTTWTLRTPPEPGEYRIAAVFLYGTEKAHPLGVVMKNDRPEPRGGPHGASGRIMFSPPVSMAIK